MKNKIISSLIFSGILAFSANAADFGGKLYLEDATIEPGETAVLSIQLENDIEVCGFQLQMILPAGISYNSWSINPDRLPAGASTSDMITMQRFESGKLTIAGVLNFGVGTSFTQNSGELATVVIAASPDTPSGVYTVYLQNVDVNDPSGIDYDVSPTSFTLTVGEQMGIETIQMKDGAAQVYDLLGRSIKEARDMQIGIENGQVIYRK